MSVVKEYVKSNQAGPSLKGKELVVDMLDKSRSSSRLDKSRSSSSEGDLPNIVTQKQNFISKTNNPPSGNFTGNLQQNWQKARPASARRIDDSALHEFTSNEV